MFDSSNDSYPPGSDTQGSATGGADHVVACQPAWQREMADAVRSIDELLPLVGLKLSQLDYSDAALKSFRLRVPRGFVRRMRRGDPQDPLLLQVLPRALETENQPGFVTDPVADLVYSKGKGVIHKYRNRILLVTTGACAVHCRYCFRRHFPYAEQNPRGQDKWCEVLDTLRASPEVDEVILSGGDPLSLPDASLASLLAGLDTIPQIRSVRIHSRLPVVLPSRIDQGLLAVLRASRKKLVMVIHANHPNELDADTDRACRQLAAIGVALFNQSVLLRGVNDDADILINLSQRLFDAGVIPYYLNLLDRVAGAAHFEVDEVSARRLVNAMRARLAGYLVPRLVRDVPGGAGKTIIDLGACRV